KTPWKIVVQDSSGIPENTRAAVAHLADKEKVIAIVAVAAAADAADAAQEAELRKVPLILIAAREGLTDKTGYVFQHFLTATQQASALAKYALDDMNAGVYAILYPRDDYGQEMVKAFRMEAEKTGGKVERAISYGKNQTDFTEEINKVSGYAISAAKAAAAAGKAESKTKVAVDFEALFIPDSDLRVKMIASQLAFYDIKGIRLLGTSLWNSPDLLKKNVEPLEGAVFVDSFFTGSFYPETNDFMDIYYTSYRREPENIEALAYDTTAIVISVLEDYRIGTREQFAEALRKVENYQGVTGRISFGADGVARKTPFIIKVINGKLQQVK
ncbi:MAG TPA: penicillin-binding protein activator, partial [Smithellaceae bacterium]|nr:penicillin-binding protein activator [Smithellaceae bacterium]